MKKKRRSITTTESKTSDRMHLYEIIKIKFTLQFELLYPSTSHFNQLSEPGASHRSNYYNFQQNLMWRIRLIEV